MTYYNIVAASPSIQKMVRQDLPLFVSYKLYKMINHLNEEITFYQNKVEELQSKYNGVNSQEYLDEYNALINLEVDWDEKPIDVNINLGINISAADVSALEPFINFVDE